jgi:hypothetical protein
MRFRWVVLAVVGALLAACAPGTPDLGFAPKGSTPYGPVAGMGGARSLVPLPDGSVVATRGGARALTRVSGTGQVDPNWGASLPSDCDSAGGALATGSRILFLCGRLRPPSGPMGWQLWRVTTGGQLDPGFGGGDGIVDLPARMVEVGVAPLPAGGVLALGHEVLPPSRTSVPPLLTTVLSPTGHVVASETLPITVPALPDQLDGYRLGAGLVATPTGALAVESLTSTVNGTSTELGQNRQQHFSAAGAALDDPPWGSPGALGIDRIAAVVPLADGRIVQAATTTAIDVEFHHVSVSSSLRATAADGSPDAGFGNGGTVVLDIPGVGRLDPTAMLATNDEHFLFVVGTDPTGAPRIARYDAATGAIDPNFGNAGSLGVLLARVEAVAARTGTDQLYLAGLDAQSRPAVTRIWNQVSG